MTEQLSHAEVIRRANAGRRRQASELRATQPFAFTWRSTAEQRIIRGWDAAAKELGIQPNSLRSRISSRRSAYAEFQRTHPLTGELDILVVTRLKLERKVNRPRGRPRKLTEQDLINATTTEGDK